MHSFRTLDLAIEFARQCHNVKIPRYLKDQLDRASSSVALNLAEGSAKSSREDRNRSYEIALGSFRESETILRIVDVENQSLKNLTHSLAGSITNLCRSTR